MKVLQLQEKYFKSCRYLAVLEKSSSISPGSTAGHIHFHVKMLVSRYTFYRQSEESSVKYLDCDMQVLTIFVWFVPTVDCGSDDGQKYDLE
jgi:hypothetical protein